LGWKIRSLYLKLSNKLYYFKMKHKYHDYIEDEYNYGDLKFIWGIKSWDDLSGKDANIYTMNDIEIDYDRKSKEYILSIETIYHFKEGNLGEVSYLDKLLNAFTKFMIENNYNTNEPYTLYLMQTENIWRANDIPTLYTQFKLFVEGYKSLCKLPIKYE